MVGIERIKQYSTLPQEAAEVVEPRPPAAWPSSGQLEVRDLEIKYAPNLPTVLHKINFTVEAGKRCAVVGSTGSGKVRDFGSLLANSHVLRDPLLIVI